MYAWYTLHAGCTVRSTAQAFVPVHGCEWRAVPKALLTVKMVSKYSPKARFRAILAWEGGQILFPVLCIVFHAYIYTHRASSKQFCSARRVPSKLYPLARSIQVLVVFSESTLLEYSHRKPPKPASPALRGVVCPAHLCS